MSKLAVLLFFFVSLGMVHSEAITKVGVININKVFLNFRGDSSAMRAIENERLKNEEEVGKINQQIQDIKARKLDATNKGDENTVQKLNEDLRKRQQYLQDFIAIRSTQLQEKLERLTDDSSFMRDLQREIDYVAETGGFSMIFRSESNDLLWLGKNKELDITDAVIERLKLRSNRN